MSSSRLLTAKRLSESAALQVKRYDNRFVRYNRELPTRAKRAMKEMLVFWKRNEKEEREARKRAEREQLEKIKREDELREAKRQQRKLNFLISQTELYSHFIGRKIGTEGLDAPAALASGASVSIDPMAAEIDYDNDDDATIHAKARIGAQAALEAHMAKTREFDAETRGLRNESDKDDPVNVDENMIDHMDFLNPSSLKEDSDIKKPDMLNCQLKAYQVKGLNWLANLYEQGINGILADEMVRFFR